MKQLFGIQKLWAEALTRHEVMTFLRCGGVGTEVLQRYARPAFYKRALRLATGLRTVLRLQPGDRVGFFDAAADESALCFHACLLAGLIAVPLGDDISAAGLQKLLNAKALKGLVYQPGQAARLAMLQLDRGSVEHWILSGKDAQSRRRETLPGGAGRRHRLFDLMSGQQADFEALRADTEDPLGLSIFHESINGDGQLVLQRQDFRHQQLMRGAESWAMILDSRPPSSLLAEELEKTLLSGYPMTSVHGLVLNTLVPLVFDCGVFLPAPNSREGIWQVAAREKAFAVVMDFHTLRHLDRLPVKPSVSLLQPRYIINTESRFSLSFLKNCEKKRRLCLETVFAPEQAAGPLTGFLFEREQKFTPEWEKEFPIPSSGNILPGVQLHIRNAEGELLGEKEPGELFFSLAMGAAKEDFVATGVIGFRAEDQGGQNCIFCVGRKSEIIEREGSLVNLAKVREAVLEIPGILYADVFSFPNDFVGQEIGLFVIFQSKVIEGGKKEILSRLQSLLAEHEMPRLFIRGNRNELHQTPSRTELIRKVVRDNRQRDLSFTTSDAVEKA